jgi:monovalent cation/proton antiporter MnhG/PhaG subunit
VTEYVVIGLLWIGAVFTLIAAIGIVRFPDFFLRMHASAKAATVGIVSGLLALTLHFDDPAIRARALLIALFMSITAPIVAQVLTHAALVARTPMCARTHCNEWAADSERKRDDTE